MDNEIVENLVDVATKHHLEDTQDPNIIGLRKLQKVIAELKVPKTGFNKFGGFNYRTLDDIIDSLRPLCLKYGIVYVLRDHVTFTEGRWYIVTYVHVYDVDTGKLIVVGEGWAREADKKAKFDEAQISGATSTYARKYALCGVFDIAEGTDEDSIAGIEQPAKPQQAKPHTADEVVDLLNGYNKQFNDNISYDNFMAVLYPQGVSPENIDFVLNNFREAVLEFNRRSLAMYNRGGGQ